MRALQGIDLIETQILPTVFEPGGRGFESLRARHIFKHLRVTGKSFGHAS